MDARLKPQRFDVRTERLEKICANSRRLALIKPIAIDQVGLGQIKQPKFHAVFAIFRRILAFASSQSEKVALPAL
jgi:hypothetical protein